MKNIKKIIYYIDLKIFKIKNNTTDFTAEKPLE